MKLTSLAVTDLLDSFRSGGPTPGGGSAAALAGAIGASLLAMVSALPKSRAVTETDIARLKAAGDLCVIFSNDLEALVDRDSEAYDGVVAAYRNPKSSDAEKAARSIKIQAAMREAIAAPLAIMRACAAAAEQGVVIAALGNPSASSDLQVGLEMLGAALRGASLNVDVNLGSVKDAAYVAATRTELEEFAQAFAHQADAARKTLL
jgi:formiminotetrahydrofolate cyclodeaminase